MAKRAGDRSQKIIQDTETLIKARQVVEDSLIKMCSLGWPKGTSELTSGCPNGDLKHAVQADPVWGFWVSEWEVLDKYNLREGQRTSIKTQGRNFRPSKK